MRTAQRPAISVIARIIPAVGAGSRHDSNRSGRVSQSHRRSTTSSRPVSRRRVASWWLMRSAVEIIHAPGVPGRMGTARGYPQGINGSLIFPFYQGHGGSFRHAILKARRMLRLIGVLILLLVAAIQSGRTETVGFAQAATIS